MTSYICVRCKQEWENPPKRKRFECPEAEFHHILKKKRELEK